MLFNNIIKGMAGKVGGQLARRQVGGPVTQPVPGCPLVTKDKFKFISTVEFVLVCNC